MGPVTITAIISGAASATVMDIINCTVIVSVIDKVKSRRKGKRCKMMEVLDDRGEYEKLLR